MIGKDLVGVVAQAIGEAFWETAEQPRSWAGMTPQQREVFRLCAVRAIDAAKAFRADRVKERA